MAACNDSACLISVISFGIVFQMRMAPVAYPELVSGGFPKVAHLSGW